MLEMKSCGSIEVLHIKPRFSPSMVGVTMNYMKNIELYVTALIPFIKTKNPCRVTKS